MIVLSHRSSTQAKCDGSNTVLNNTKKKTYSGADPEGGPAGPTFRTQNHQPGSINNNLFRQYIKFRFRITMEGS